MGANPLTYTELEAFERKALVSLSAWEADLVMRLDDTVLKVWNEKAGQKPQTDSTDIPITDTARIREMVKARAAQRRLEEQARAQARAEKAKRRG